MIKKARNKTYIPKMEKAPRVVVSGDILHVKGRPYQLKRNVEPELENGKPLSVKTNDGKFCFRLKKLGKKVLLLKMKERGRRTMAKKPRPSMEKHKSLIGQIDSNAYIKLANGND